MTILDKKLTTSGSDIEITHTNSGELLTGIIGKYIPSGSQALLSLSNDTFSNGVNLMFEIDMPSIPGGSNFAHFEAYLSYEPDLILNGLKKQDILYKFVSTEVDGWIVENENANDFPGSGLNSSFVGDTVKKFALNLEIDLSKTLYYYIRAVFFNGTVQTNVFSDFEGGIIDHYQNYRLNTSDNKSSNCVIDLETSTTVWPIGKNIGFELYLGNQPNPNNYTTDYLVYRDSFDLSSGFYYFNGVELVRLPSLGISDSFYGNSMLFHTNTFDVSQALYVSYRAKWDTGNSEWITKLLNCSVTE